MQRHNFARGVILTIQHVFTTLGDMANQLSTAALEQDKQYAPVRFQWTLPMLNSRMFEDSASKLYLPFIIPEFQEDFDSTYYVPKTTTRILREVSISWDSAAEPYGIVDNYYPANIGTISACDMERYTTYIKLYEKTPTILGGNTYERTEVASITIPGVEAYGGQYFRGNPLCVDTLRIPLHPYRTYFWEVSVPGLYALVPADDTLCMPSFTVQCKVLAPLTARDEDAGGIEVQNLPVVHNGQKQLGAVTVTTPAADAIINGDTDLQDQFKTIEIPFRDKLQHGYGCTPGMESDVFPEEHINKDAALSVIIVPMWNGFEDWRMSETASKGIPYSTGPNYTAPTCDRRLLVVPDSFTLHHAFAVWSTACPPCANTGGNVLWGIFPPASATLTNAVGVALNSGIAGDDYKYQQVAYATWTPLTYANITVDSFDPDINNALIPAAWHLLHLPIVSNNVGTNNSFQTSGAPFFMGTANSNTQERTLAGEMPTIYGGLNYVTPATNGGETTLELRWLIHDAINGLADAARPNDVIVGVGGNWIILVGKTTISG